MRFIGQGFGPDQSKDNFVGEIENQE